MRGRGRGRGGGGEASLPGMTASIQADAEEDTKLPPPDFPDLWVEGGYKFQPILPCTGNEPYKARMAIKIQTFSKNSPFFLEPDEPTPEIQTWAKIHQIFEKPLKKKPSEVMEFNQQLFPLELLPKKMQTSIKKDERNKRKRSDDDIMSDIHKREKEDTKNGPDFEKIEKDGSQSEEEKKGSDEEIEDNEDKDIEDEEDQLGDVDAAWKHNDDDSLGEEASEDDETYF